MRHQVSSRRFDRPTGPRQLMIRNLVTEVLDHTRITTTEAKAKAIRSPVEKMITLGKAGKLHHRRQALSFITDERVVDKLFAEVAPRYAQRNGGYTRVIKLGPRSGDGAAMAIIELVE
ncbi:MAG: 50S ribosomal protein L17 [Dehalococcoidia bacterium]|nr:50S ribosomal protein L17 [Dehalococcoidia bacterium]